MSKPIKMSDDVVVGWEEIAFHTPFSADVMRKRYGKEMLNSGYVFRTHIGKSKRPRVWAYLSMVKIFFAVLQSKNKRI